MLNVADGDRVAEFLEGIAARDPLVPDVAGILGLLKGLHHGAIVDFLVFIDHSTTWVAGDLDMTDEFMVRFDPTDEIAVHDLDVIGVEEHLEAGGRDGADDVEAFVEMIALISGMPHHIFRDP